VVPLLFTELVELLLTEGLFEDTDLLDVLLPPELLEEDDLLPA